jgi:hypothetical protein
MPAWARMSVTPKRSRTPIIQPQRPMPTRFLPVSHRRVRRPREHRRPLCARVASAKRRAVDVADHAQGEVSNRDSPRERWSTLSSANAYVQTRGVHCSR